MAKKITVIGTGYVGLVSSVGLADFGNYVTGVDINEKIVETLNGGTPTIYEHGIDEYLSRNLDSGRLAFSTDIDGAIQQAEIVFLAVGTPSLESGNADLSQIEAAVQAIGRNLNGFKVVVTKSTVPVGTNRKISTMLAEAARGAAAAGGGQATSARQAPSGGGSSSGGGAPYAVVSNPEFLREGRAIHDFFHPDRVVIGYEEGTEAGERAREYMEDVYRALYLIQTPFVWCNLETAELIKYAANAFLATKITFINQMAQLAEATGSDIHAIAKAMGMDGRISPKFLHPGPGYGGSCFPKDTKAIAATGDEYRVEMSLLKSVISANEGQKRWVVEKLSRLAGDISGKTVAVLGLAFKSETDDVRESPAITIVQSLLEHGAAVRAHDPKAIENFKLHFPKNVTYCESEFEALTGADCAIVVTEWNEYRNLDLTRARKQMRGNTLLDARNVLDPEAAKELGFTYAGVGR
jgi:UDPglucose 6-dehydrogenase